MYKRQIMMIIARNRIYKNLSLIKFTFFLSYVVLFYQGSVAREITPYSDCTINLFSSLQLLRKISKSKKECPKSQKKKQQPGPTFTEQDFAEFEKEFFAN